MLSFEKEVVFQICFRQQLPGMDHSFLPDTWYRIPETLKIKVHGNNHNPMYVRLNAPPFIFLTLDYYVSLEE